MKIKSNLLFFSFLFGLLFFVSCHKDTITTTDEPAGDNVGDSTDTDPEFDRTVSIVYSADNATVSGNGGDQTVTISSAGVTIVNTGSEKVLYDVSGSTSNGFLKIYSEAKQAVKLNSASITNTSGAAVNIQSKKTTYVILTGASTLSDGSTYASAPGNEDEKAALFAEGSLRFGGSGSLTVMAKGKSGIVSDDNVTITEGSITINCTSNTFVTDGDTTKVAGIKSDDDFTINGGSLTITCSGSGAKGISGNSAAYFAGGTVDITVTGSNFGSSGNGGGQSSSDNSVAAKGIKFDGDINITGGSVTVSSSSDEAVESKAALNISGGYLYATSSDDAINSTSDLTISGGYVMAHSTGNDGIDANGNLYVQGGNILAISAGGAEVAIDANSEEQKKLYVTGGNLVAIGGLERGASISGGTVKQTSSYSKGTWYALYNDGTVAFAFKVPTANRMGTPMVVYTTGTPSLKSGVSGSGTSFWNGNGYTECSGGSDVSLSNYSGNTGGGGHGGH